MSSELIPRGFYSEPRETYVELRERVTAHTRSMVDNARDYAAVKDTAWLFLECVAALHDLEAQRDRARLVADRLTQGGEHDAHT